MCSNKKKIGLSESTVVPRRRLCMPSHRIGWNDVGWIQAMHWVLRKIFSASLQRMLNASSGRADWDRTLGWLPLDRELLGGCCLAALENPRTCLYAHLCKIDSNASKSEELLAMNTLCSLWLASVSIIAAALVCSPVLDIFMTVMHSKLSSLCPGVADKCLVSSFFTWPISSRSFCGSSSRHFKDLSAAVFSPPELVPLHIERIIPFFSTAQNLVHRRLHIEITNLFLPVSLIYAFLLASRMWDFPYSPMTSNTNSRNLLSATCCWEISRWSDKFAWRLQTLIFSNRHCSVCCIADNIKFCIVWNLFRRDPFRCWMCYAYIQNSIIMYENII